LIAYHEVIHEFNIEMLSRCDQLLGYSYVFRVRRGITAGMMFQKMSPWKLLVNDLPYGSGSILVKDKFI
jgi:hypothetical protein